MLAAFAAAFLLQALPPMFVFQPSHNAPDNITNVATWPSAFPGAAGSDGFIVPHDGAFQTGSGRPIRFFGTNICQTGCFPTHADADRVAAELARYGINVVRLHYVHHQFPKGKLYPQEDSFIEPVQLERFDYFFSKLKEHGIYVYFQLNIGRKFGAHNGFENAERLPYQNKGIDIIEPRMVQLQKRFISELLGHKNPYTGLRYKEEPAISMLELSNEDSIVEAWFTARNRFPWLVDPYGADLKDTWNDWLLRKYGSTKTLSEAWAKGLEGDGSEFIADGVVMTGSLPGWGLQLDNAAEGTMTVMEASPKDKLRGSHFIRISVDKIGTTANMPQFYRSGLAFKSMQPLCLKMKIRSNQPTSFKVRFSQNHAPWMVVGLQADVEAGKKWKEYSFSFCASLSDENVRLIISNFSPAVIDVADVSLTSGIDYKWPKQQSLEDGTVDWPYRTDWSMPPQRAKDFTEFLAYLESYYFSSMYSHTKNVVKAKQPVTGTQLHYGFDLYQSKMDYVDVHDYWNHPVSTTSLWNPKDWSVARNPQVNGNGFSGSGLSSVARDRILGKPFTISEYDHPNVNYYAAEGNLMATAMGAFQNWSGIVQFSWLENDDFFREYESPRFDMCGATQKLVHLPACYAMFVRGDVTKGNTDTLFVRTSSLEKDIRTVAMAQAATAVRVAPSQLLGAMPLALVSGEQIAENPSLFPEDGHVLVRAEEDVPANLKSAFANKEMKSGTGEITWNWQQSGAGYFKVDTDNTKVFSGFVRGRSFDYDGLVLTPGETMKDWLTLSLTLSNPSPEKAGGTLKKGNWLLAVTGMCRNEDEVIVERGQFLTVSEVHGGSYGKGPVVCEGIPADITLTGLAGKVSCFALDPDGARMQEVKIKSDASGNAILRLSPEYKTVWYELIVR